MNSIIGFVLFIISFTISSLLPFYLGFLLLYILLLLWENSETSIFKLLSLKNILLLVLPIGYWIIKGYLFPRHGAYADYNQFILTTESLWINTKFFITDSILFPLLHPIPLYLIIAILLCKFIASFLIKRKKNDFRLDFPEAKQALRMCIYGFVLFALGTLPYILVGKSPRSFGMETRHALLVAYPASIILVSLLSFFSKNIRGSILSIIIVSFALQNVSNYFNYQARWVKDISIIKNLRQSSVFNESSLIYVVADNFYIEGTDIWYTSDWYGIAKMVLGDEKHAFFALPSTRNEADFEEKISKQDFRSRYLQGNVDRLGCRSKLFIYRGDRQYDNVALSLRYYYYRFLRPAQLDQFLAAITYLRIEPIQSTLATNCKQW